MAARITWTTQVCTTVSGKTLVMASGSPLSPSQQAIRTSRSPRLRSWVSTECQNFAPSASAIQTPRACLRPSTSTPTTRWATLIVTAPLSRILSRIPYVDDRVDLVDRPVAPQLDLIGDDIGDVRDHFPGGVHPVDLEQVG